MKIHQSEKVLRETVIVFVFSVALELSFVQLQVNLFRKGKHVAQNHLSKQT